MCSPLISREGKTCIFFMRIAKKSVQMGYYEESDISVITAKTKTPHFIICVSFPQNDLLFFDEKECPDSK